MSTPSPTPKPAPAAKAKVPAKPRATRAKAPAKAATPKPAAKPTPPPAPAPVPEPKPEPSSSGSTKALKFSTLVADYCNTHKAQANQWVTAHSRSQDGRVTLTATNAETRETIVLVWDGDTEVYNYPESVYTRETGNVGSWTIRNVSEAGKIVRREVTKGGSGTSARVGRPRSTSSTDKDTESSEAPSRATRTGRSRKSDPNDRPATDLPFALDDPDEVILSMLADKTIKWRAGAVLKTSTVNSKHLKVMTSKNTDTPGRKYIQFAEDDGFKTVYLDKIRKVIDSK